MLKNLPVPAEQRLLIDSGALLFGHGSTRSITRLSQDKVRAEAIVAAYNLMGYEAVGIGKEDLVAGLAFVRDMAAMASFPFLSANIVGQDGAPLFPPSTLVKKNGLTIGITAVTNPRGKSGGGEYQIRPWQQVLPSLVDDLAARCDFVILLSNLPREENNKISAALPQVHLLIQSGVLASNMVPTLVNNTLMTQTTQEGKYLGELAINWTKSRRWQAQEDSLVLVQRKLDRLLWEIKRLERRGRPEEVFKDAPRTLDHYRNIKVQAEQLQTRVEELKAKQREPGFQPEATYTVRFRPIKKSIVDDPEVRHLLAEKNQMINKIVISRGKIHQFQSYLGSDGCQSCHGKIYAAWQQTPHARAYQTLLKKKQHHNVNCVWCHVTALNENTADLIVALNRNMLAVGCEQCHGPGRAHAAEPEKIGMVTNIPAARCRGCHTPEQDDNFDFDRKKGLVH